jgi:hypothetical protein
LRTLPRGTAFRGGYPHTAFARRDPVTGYRETPELPNSTGTHTVLLYAVLPFMIIFIQIYI